MKKRLLLILAFGVSISPAVFADSDLPLVVHHTGVEKLTETDMRGVQCQYSRLRREIESSLDQDATPAAGGASVAGR